MNATTGIAFGDRVREVIPLLAVLVFALLVMTILAVIVLFVLRKFDCSRYSKTDAIDRRGFLAGANAPSNNFL